MDTLNFYIDGRWVDSVCARKTMGVINPATEEIVANACLAGEEDIDAALCAAHHAFNSWRLTPVEQRKSLMRSFLQAYKSRYEEIAQAMTVELGVPIDFSRAYQAESGVGHTEVFLEAIDKTQEEERVGQHTLIVREPIGVCALITPWNWPINQVISKVAPALLAGCTVVLKPSSLTPLSANLFARCMAEAGFPPGVFNLILGEGREIGHYLTSHPLVDMVSFTGSTRAGVEIAKSAADTVKRVAQELGGKSPNIIFSDANLEVTITNGVLNCMSNSGQSCDAPTRMLIERSVYQQGVAIAQRVTQSIKVDEPSKSGEHLGPVVSQRQWGIIQEYIQIGIDEGATLLAGGMGKPDGMEVGYYVKPTLFSDVNNDMRIAREEIFGPVLVLIPFDSEEEAIAIANDTSYGLGAYVSTRDIDRGRRVARQLNAGTLHINDAAHEYEAPYGGYKQSGNGREYGVHGIVDFQEIKAISGYFSTE